MLKLTRGAISFLLAQYRAIYKHAYVKGLASAIAVSAFVIPAAANAEAKEQPTAITADNLKADLTLDAGKSYNLGAADVTAGEPSEVTNVAITNNGTVTFNQGLAPYTEKTLSLSNKGTATVDADTKIIKIKTVENAAGATLNVTAGTLGESKDTVTNAGTFNVTGGTVASDVTNTGKMAVTNGTVSGKITHNATGAENALVLGKVKATHGDVTSTTVAVSDVTVAKDAVVKLAGGITGSKVGLNDVENNGSIVTDAGKGTTIAATINKLDNKAGSSLEVSVGTAGSGDDLSAAPAVTVSTTATNAGTIKTLKDETKTGTLKVTGKFTNAATGVVENNGELTLSGALENSGNFTSTGKLAVTGDITNKADANLTIGGVATVGDVENEGILTITGGQVGNVTNKAATALLVDVSAGKSVTIESIDDKTTGVDQTTTLTTAQEKNITVKGDVKSVAKIAFAGDAGKTTVKNVIADKVTAGEGSETHAYADVTKTGAGEVEVQGGVTGKSLTVEGGTFSVNDRVAVKGAVTTSGDATVVTFNKGVENTTNANIALGGKSVTVGANDKGSAVYSKGAVTIDAAKSTITGDVEGAGAVAIKSGTAEGDSAVVTGNVTGETVALGVASGKSVTINGNVTATKDSGDVVNVVAGKVEVSGTTTTAALTVTDGDATFNGLVAGAKNADTKVTVTKGKAKFGAGVKGDLDSKADAEVTLNAGVTGSLKSVGNLILDGNFEQFGTANSITGSVDIDNGAKLSIGKADALSDNFTVGESKTYNVKNGTLNAKKITVEGTLDIKDKGVLTDKTIEAVTGTLKDAAGGLTVKTSSGAITAEKDITLTAVTDGTATVSGKATVGTVTGGTVTLKGEGSTVDKLSGGALVANGTTVNVKTVTTADKAVSLGTGSETGTVKVTDSLTASANNVTVNAGTTLDVTDLIDSSKLVTVDTEKTITKKAQNLTGINVEGKTADITTDKITGDGTLKVADLSGNSITTTVSDALKALFDTNSNSKLFLDIGNVTTTAKASSATDTYVNVKGQYSNVVLQKTEGAAPDLVVNEAKVEDKKELKVKSEGGNFVSASDGSAAKVTLGSGSEFTTVGSGTIGDVKATNNTQGTFNVQPGNVTAGDVTANVVKVYGNLTAKAVDSATTSLGENASVNATGDVSSTTSTKLGVGSSITGKSVTVKTYTAGLAKNVKLAATGGDLKVTADANLGNAALEGVTLMASDAVTVDKALTLGDKATIIGNKGVTVSGDLTLGKNANVVANGDTGLALAGNTLEVKAGSTIAASKIANSGTATFTVGETDRAVSSLTAEKLDLQSAGGVTLNNVNTKIGSQGAVVMGALTAEKGSFESSGAVNVNGALDAKVDSFKAKSLAAGAAATFTNAQVTLDDDSSVTGALKVDGGSLAAAKKLTLKADATLTNGADVKVGTADLAADKTITVGEAEGKNATFFANNLVGGAGSKLIIDPAFTEKASVGAAHGGAGDGNQLSTLTGVGQNSAFGWGVSSVSEAINALTQAGYMSNGKFSESGVGTAAYLARTLDLARGSLKLANQAAEPTTGDAGTLSLDNKTALLLTTNVIGDAAKAGTAVITNATATVESGSEIAVTGEIDGSVMGANVALATDASGNVQDFTKSTFVDKTNSNLFDLSFDGKRFNGTYDKLIDFNLSKASTPVANYLKAALPTIRKGAGVGANYILANNLIDQGESLNGIARLGAFSGAISVAQMAADQTTQATATRLGTSHSQALIDGDKNQGFAVWANPFYRSSNSSSLDAQGTEYGVDANLAGISIGADATFNNTRVGAVITLGSASVDPKDAASQVDNDANTFGAGLYAGTTLFGDFTLTGDLSYTRVQNDITLKTPTFGFDKLTADGDSSVWTLGVTGAYNIDLGNGLKLAPHAGLRYSSYDLDSLAVNSMQGVVANNSYEKMNVFSIPVGVNLTKTFKVGDWALNTVGDLGLTFNAGDKDLESTTTFTGVAGSCKTESEVFDSVVFNGNVGLDANLGNLNIGAATGFKVGSNNKEFGINADARYSF